MSRSKTTDGGVPGTRDTRIRLLQFSLRKQGQRTLLLIEKLVDKDWTDTYPVFYPDGQLGAPLL